MSNSKEEFKSRELSNCCNVSVGEVFTFPSVVEKWKRDYGVQLPYNKNVKTCNLCKEKCETRFVLC
jgi:hypothetical protein